LSISNKRLAQQAVKNHPAAFGDLLEACEIMVNSRKACLASESFLDLDMTIPTEPIEHPAPAKAYYGLRAIRTRKLISGRVRIDMQ
jgi:hypothetical protein